MPENIKIGSFVLGAILVLIAILGGNFKLFGAEVAASVSNRWLRSMALVLGLAFVASAMYPFVPGSDRPDPGLPPTSGSSETPSPGTLASTLQAANIDFSRPELREQLNNRYSLYPQFAAGCLKTLGARRFKNEVYFDVLFSDYADLGGKVDPESADGSLDGSTLERAMLSAYNIRNGSNATRLGQILKART